MLVISKSSFHVSHKITSIVQIYKYQLCCHLFASACFFQTKNYNQSDKELTAKIKSRYQLVHNPLVQFSFFVRSVCIVQYKFNAITHFSKRFSTLYRMRTDTIENLNNGFRNSLRSITLLRLVKSWACCIYFKIVQKQVVYKNRTCLVPIIGEKMTSTFRC